MNRDAITSTRSVMRILPHTWAISPARLRGPLASDEAERCRKEQAQQEYLRSTVTVEEEQGTGPLPGPFSKGGSTTIKPYKYLIYAHNPTTDKQQWVLGRGRELYNPRLQEPRPPHNTPVMRHPT